MLRNAWLALPAALLACAGCAGDPPTVDAAQRAELTPLIQRHLETRHLTGGALAADPGRGGRWFCGVHLIETRTRGEEVLAGAAAHCSEYARRGRSLVEGTGTSMPVLVTVKARRVTHVREGGKLNGDPKLTRTFSKAGLKEFHRISQEGYPRSVASPLDQALRAYGLPKGTPVEPS